ncbi:alpha-ketoglutarate-dependent dioxygenase AlkB, partial [Streptomyces sp. SID7499]|nr:alpha-ketoglutarate-dependent dioxygenase AlkB [Streptomyces sp. SID7499]
MAVHLQSSLFDQEAEVATAPLSGLRRTELGHG